MFKRCWAWWCGRGDSAGEVMPRHGRVLCGGVTGLQHMAYTEWGDPNNAEVVVCVHGLTRNGRDFDGLARALAPRYRVICPDVVGRGQSDWLDDKSAYAIPRYVADMMVLLARLKVERVRWVGTSMGGLIGMMIACQAKSPISHLVLNDVGPFITAEALRRIGDYVGQSPDFASPAEACAYLRQINAPFGALSDEQWMALTVSSIRKNAQGRWVMRYDPGIGEPFRQAMLLLDVNLWLVYEQIRCPTLVVRGAESDLLTAETAAQMTQRGPQARLVEFAGVGHAPMFSDAAQIAAVRDFFDCSGSETS